MMNGFDPTFRSSGAAYRAGSVPDPGNTAGTMRMLYENTESREPIYPNAPCSWPIRPGPQIFNLMVSTGPDFGGSPPGHWTALLFDDSVWPEAVVNGPGYITGTDKIWYEPARTPMPRR